MNRLLIEKNESLRALLKSSMEAFEIILLDKGIKLSTSNICKKEISKIKKRLENDKF